MIDILLADDNEKLRKMTAMYLSHAGYNILEAENGVEAMSVLDKHYVDIIVADIMMPQMDGLEFAELVRTADREIPILLVTVKSGLDDKRRGFLAGADDYIVKPVHMEELVMRIEALLRRANIRNTKALHIGDTILREDSLTVLWADTVTVLPQREFLVLQKLLCYPNKIFTRQALMDEIWGFESDSDPRTVDVHVSRLRNRFYQNTDFKIETVRGLGYRAVIKDET